MQYAGTHDFTTRMQKIVAYKLNANSFKTQRFREGTFQYVNDTALHTICNFECSMPYYPYS